MKTTCLMAALAVCIVGGCSKPAAITTPEPTPEPAPVVVAPPPAPAQPPPVAVAVAVETAEPPARNLAPDGIFFLLVRKSIETESGFQGVAPGARLKFAAPGMYEIEGQKIALRDDEVTNDLDIARQIAGADAAAQQALRQRSASEAAKARALQLAREAQTGPAPREAGPASSMSAPPASSVSSAISEGGSTGLQTSGGIGATHSKRDSVNWHYDSNGRRWRLGIDGSRIYSK